MKPEATEFYTPIPSKNHTRYSRNNLPPSDGDCFLFDGFKPDAFVSAKDGSSPAEWKI